MKKALLLTSIILLEIALFSFDDGFISIMTNYHFGNYRTSGSVPWRVAFYKWLLVIYLTK